MLYTAFLMGLVGSLHCAVMCGPLMLAVPRVGRGTWSMVLSRLFYNGGRVLIYALLGSVFGLAGKSVVLMGLQQSLSLGTGLAMVVGLLLASYGRASPLAGMSINFRRIFARFLTQRSYLSTFILGAANGFLPCGLVYLAGTASIACGNVLESSLYMIVFGMGTLPMTLGITICRDRVLKLIAPTRFVPAASLAVGFVALSLILRGLALGIPYVSPAKTMTGIVCRACDTAPETHKP